MPHVQKECKRKDADSFGMELATGRLRWSHPQGEYARNGGACQQEKIDTSSELHWMYGPKKVLTATAKFAILEVTRLRRSQGLAQDLQGVKS